MASPTLCTEESAFGPSPERRSSPSKQTLALVIIIIIIIIISAGRHKPQLNTTQSNADKEENTHTHTHPWGFDAMSCPVLSRLLSSLEPGMAIFFRIHSILS